MINIKNKQKSFGKKADEFLKEFYDSVGSKTTEQKINLLNIKMGGEYNFYSSGIVTNEQILGCLEYEFLEKNGMIKLHYC